MIEFGQLKPQAVNFIGHQRTIATGARQYTQAIAPYRGTYRNQLKRLEKFSRSVHSNNTESIKQGLIEPV